MKENVDKHIETLVDKAMKQSVLETPSFDFTANVMAQVEKQTQNATTTYQPLISKRIWIMIFTGFVGFVGYILFVTKPEASGWVDSIDFNTINIEKVANLFNSVHPSKIVAYAVALLSIMLLIQIPILKRYFDRRIEF